MSEPSMDLVCVACGRDYGNHVGDYCHPLAARSVPPSMFTPAPDPRDAEIAALRARVAELEADAKIGRVVREFDAEARDILGRPCFTCGRIAEVLRRMGRTIPPKAEDEQAEVLRWMLGLYAEHGAQWREKGDDELRAALAATEVQK